MNPALIGMTFGEMTAVTIDGIEGWKVAMSGVMAGQIAGEGEVFCADIDNACVIAFTAGKDAVPSFTDKFIGSIQVNKEAVDAIQADPIKAVDMVADVPRTNLPMQVDEVTIWNDIIVDHDSRTVALEMKVPGTASDYEGFIGDSSEALNELRNSMIQDLRAGKSYDMLISVPVTYDYTISYRYSTPDTNEPVFTIDIPAEELK